MNNQHSNSEPWRNDQVQSKIFYYIFKCHRWGDVHSVNSYFSKTLRLTVSEWAHLPHMWHQTNNCVWKHLVTCFLAPHESQGGVGSFLHVTNEHRSTLCFVHTLQEYIRPINWIFGPRRFLLTNPEELVWFCDDVTLMFLQQREEEEKVHLVSDQILLTPD